MPSAHTFYSISLHDALPILSVVLVDFLHRHVGLNKIVHLFLRHVHTVGWSCIRLLLGYLCDGCRAEKKADGGKECQQWGFDAHNVSPLVDESPDVGKTLPLTVT